MRLSLAKIVFGSFRLAEQKGDMFVGGLDESPDGNHRLFELLDEFLVLLVTPACPQGLELAVQDGHLILGLGTKSPKCGGESTQFIGIHDGLRHGRSPVENVARSALMTADYSIDLGEAGGSQSSPRGFGRANSAEQ